MAFFQIFRSQSDTQILDTFTMWFKKKVPSTQQNGHLLRLMTIGLQCLLRRQYVDASNRYRAAFQHSKQCQMDIYGNDQSVKLIIQREILFQLINIYTYKIQDISKGVLYVNLFAKVVNRISDNDGNDPLFPFSNYIKQVHDEIDSKIKKSFGNKIKFDFTTREVHYHKRGSRITIKGNYKFLYNLQYEKERNVFITIIKTRKCPVCNLLNVNKKFHVTKKIKNRKCSACKNIWYCSKQHQKQHWCIHKKHCNVL